MKNKTSYKIQSIGEEVNEKYKELGAFETNEFKVGDLVVCIDSSKIDRGHYKVETSRRQYLTLSYCGGKSIDKDHEGIEVHFKTCFKLVEVEPREFYLRKALVDEIFAKNSTLDYVIANLENRPQWEGDIWTKVREVLDGE